MRTKYCLSAGVLLGLLGSSQTPLAGACDHTTRLMSTSCDFEVNEEYFAKIAVCQNISDYIAKRDCDFAAADERKEAREECGAAKDMRLETCDLLGEERYDPDPLLDPSIEFVDPDDIGDSVDPNPYFSLVPGRTSIVRAGEDGEELVVITASPEVKEIQGVDCRVVVDAALIVEEEDGETSYEIEELTDDWYAQSSVGDVYYCGELSRNYEDGELDNLDGSFTAGREDAKSGVLIRANPVAGEAHRQEWALGEAEDVVQYLSLAAGPDEEGGENEAFPCNGACLQTFDFAPPDPADTEHKYYIADVGFVLATKFEDGELIGEREELVCTGDSIDILDDPTCGIDDVEQVKEVLCDLAPDAFCPDE